MPKEPRYTVFEAINDKRKEIFIAITQEQIFETMAKIQKERPPAIRHWNLDEVVNVRSIEFNLSEDSAKDFLREYVKVKAQPGWRYLTGVISLHAA